ncbi:MAG: hypothetical protein ACPGVO_20000 [Spirulinaceae cyanobacterium]
MLPWLRWWDASGKLLLDGQERAILAEDQAQKLAAKLRELGVDPGTIA